MKLRRVTTLSLRKRLATALLLVASWSPAAGPPTCRFPPFNLPDQNGQQHSSRSLLGPNGALILFQHSAGSELGEIEQNREAVRKLGLGVAAISNDTVAVLGDLAKRKGIHFPLLADSDSKIRPGWFVLDARGVVSKFFEDDPGGHYTSAAILVHQFGWMPPEPAVEVEGKQLTAKVGASNATVAPGQRVALTVDIDLNPGMHVYAPGVEGYIPIDWKMQDTQAAAVHEPQFPRSTKLYLKAIGETVPAYRGHFRLTRDVTFPLRPEGAAPGPFSVTGSLRYQACDDRVCYIPQELHLTWTFRDQASAQQP